MARCGTNQGDDSGTRRRIGFGSLVVTQFANPSDDIMQERLGTLGRLA
jgi:hypothetical protein